MIFCSKVTVSRDSLLKMIFYRHVKRQKKKIVVVVVRAHGRYNRLVQYYIIYRDDNARVLAGRVLCVTGRRLVCTITILS